MDSWSKEKTPKGLSREKHEFLFGDAEERYDFQIEYLVSVGNLLWCTFLGVLQGLAILLAREWKGGAG